MTQRNMSNILSGPCMLQLDSVDIGHTKGDIKLVIEPVLRKQSSDFFGTTPVDYVHIGEEITLHVNIAEWTSVNIENIFPFSVSSGGFINIGKAPGTKMSEITSELKLHPLELPTADTSKDIVFWKAAVAGKIEIPFAARKDRVFSVSFKIIPDLTKSAGEHIGKIGA